ncbi:MAG TPA: hypothetical protein PK869_08225 [Candidatus Hydrogenedentes bacterium]|nr:hypothetical protein [Candidatus Hydrogenedentota bacterium]
MNRQDFLGICAAFAILLGTIMWSTSAVHANDVCNLCVNTCLQRVSQCEEYFARPDVWAGRSCEPGTEPAGECVITPTTTCFTTYKICVEGTCGTSGCAGGTGCTTYTYTSMDAAPTYMGPTQCINQNP